MLLTSLLEHFPLSPSPEGTLIHFPRNSKLIKQFINEQSFFLHDSDDYIYTYMDFVANQSGLLAKKT